MKSISFAEALTDVRLLGASFRGSSWRPWHVLAKIISGQPLDDGEMALVLECTGRRVLPQNPPRHLSPRRQIQVPVCARCLGCRSRG